MTNTERNRRIASARRCLAAGRLALAAEHLAQANGVAWAHAKAHAKALITSGQFV